ncbi:hypothetical protein Tco_0593928 [Tanacetum coccineum]
MVSHGLWKIRSPVYPLHVLGLIYGRRYCLGEISYVDLIDCHLFSIEEYVVKLDELGLGNVRLLFSHFKIPCTSLDDGLASLMADEDVVKLLEYVPRFMEVDVYVKDVLVVEQHMIEVRFRNEHSKGLLIEEIVQEVGLNEDAKEDLGNKGKHVDNSPKKLSTPLEKRISDQFAFRYLLAEINLEIRNKTAEMKEKLTSLSQDDMDMPWGMLDKANEVKLELKDEIAVAEIFADLDEAYGEDELNEVDLEVEDEVSVADIFAELKQAYEEDIHSHLGEALVLEELVGCMTFNDNLLGLKNLDEDLGYLVTSSRGGHARKTNVITAEKISALICGFWVHFFIQMGEEISCENLLAKIGHEIGNKTAEMEEKLTSLSQDDMDMPWGMVAPDTDDDASISELEADEVELKLEDVVMDVDIFADLDQAYEEDVHLNLDEANKVDVDSHLDEALVLEEVGDLGMFDILVDDDSVEEPNKVDLEVEDEVGDLGFFDNVCAQMVYLEIGQREVDGQLFLGDPVDNEMTKHDAIQNSRSNVPIGRPIERKRVEYDETNLGYAPTENPMKRRKLKKDKRYATDFVDDVEE